MLDIQPGQFIAVKQAKLVIAMPENATIFSEPIAYAKPLYRTYRVLACHGTSVTVEGPDGTLREVAEQAIIAIKPWLLT